MELFEYAAWLRPTNQEKKNGKTGELFTLHARIVLAKDIESAKTLAVVDATTRAPELRNCSDRLEVAVRPFC